MSTSKKRRKRAERTEQRLDVPTGVRRAVSAVRRAQAERAFEDVLAPLDRKLAAETLAATEPKDTLTLMREQVDAVLNEPDINKKRRDAVTLIRTLREVQDEEGRQTETHKAVEVMLRELGRNVFGIDPPVEQTPMPVEDIDLTDVPVLDLIRAAVTPALVGTSIPDANTALALLLEDFLGEYLDGERNDDPSPVIERFLGLNQEVQTDNIDVILDRVKAAVPHHYASPGNDVSWSQFGEELKGVLEEAGWAFVGILGDPDDDDEATDEWRDQVKAGETTLGLDAWRAERDDNLHAYTVSVHGCTREQADKVIAERLGHDEDYGFPYTVEYS